MGKEEIARNEQFLLFPHGFLLNPKIVKSPFVNMYDITSLFTALEEPKIALANQKLCYFQLNYILGNKRENVLENELLARGGLLQSGK